MKSLIALSIIIFLIHGPSNAQNKAMDPCALLTTLLQQAHNFEADQKYIKSLNKLYSARIAARTCKGGERTKEVDQRIDSVSYEITKQREDAIKARGEAERAQKRALDALKVSVAAREAQRIALIAQMKAVFAANAAAQKADSSARITEASRLTTLALQVKEDDPTLAIQLIKKGCDTSYFNYKEAVKTLQSILSATHPASFYLNKVEKGNVDSSNVSSVALSDNGKYLIVGSYAGSIEVWDIAKTSEPGAGKPAAYVKAHNGAVLSLATSADGSVIVSGGTDGVIYLWSNTLEKQPIALAGHGGAVLSVAISANERYIASSGEDKLLNVWNLTNSTLEKKLPLPYGNAMQVCFSPDGRYIGIAGNDEAVRVWDWQHENVIAVLEGHLGAVRSVAFSPDGNYIVSGGDDKTVKVWDWKKSTVIHTLQGHQSSVMSVGFPSDTSYIVSASQDNTIKVWDLHNNQLYRELRGHQKAVFAAGFYENGRYVYSGSYDRTVKLWDWKQDYMLNPPFNTINPQKRQSIKNNLFDTKKDFSQSDTTLFSQYILTQGSDKTIWIWDSTPTLKPAYIIYNGDNDENLLPLSTDSSIINSPELYQAFYQKLIRINGKLIPVMTPDDRSRFFGTSQ